MIVRLLRYKILLSCLILFSFLSAEAFAKKGLDELIHQDNDEFSTAISKEPKGLFETTFSFSREIPIDEAIAIIMKMNKGKGKDKLTITGFFHADENSESGGAYIIPAGESLDESVDKYTNGMKTMYENHISSIRHQLTRELSSDLREQYEILLDHRLEDYDDLNASGLSIIGIRVEGKGKSLGILKKVAKDLIRVSSITDPEYVESAIAPWE